MPTCDQEGFVNSDSEEDEHPEYQEEDEILTPYLQDDSSYITCPDCGAEIVNDGGPCFYCETDPRKNEKKQAKTWSSLPLSAHKADTQIKNTKHIPIEFYLIECSHKKILRNYNSSHCQFCQKEIEGQSVGRLLVSLNRDGFLEVIGPLEVR